MEDIKDRVIDWITLDEQSLDLTKNEYCKTRDIFQARLNRFLNELLKNNQIAEDKIYIISAIVGEIGNNSFDHNLGNWGDIIGIFFDFQIKDKHLIVALADRGQGIFNSLKEVKEDLKNDQEALEVAFTEIISGRAPERRGNGLKFVRENIKHQSLEMEFYSGHAKADLNNYFEINKSDKLIKGCLAILKCKFLK